MSNETPQPINDLLREMVDRALQGIDAEPADVRARLYEAAALVLTGPEADAASQAAFHIRRAQEAQMTFHGLRR